MIDPDRRLDEARNLYEFMILRRETIESKAGIVVGANSLLLTVVGIFSDIEVLLKLLIVVVSFAASFLGFVVSANVTSAPDPPSKSILDSIGEYDTVNEITEKYATDAENVRASNYNKRVITAFAFFFTLFALLLIGVSTFSSSL